jgi:hypothetical protein
VPALKKINFMETRGQTGDSVEMKTLSSCANKMKSDGYKEDFQVTKRGLTTFSESKYYAPDQVSIVNFYRFEGTSDPGDSSILYVIETDDGLKGTLVDSYGAYSDSDVSKFIVAVEEIQKKIHTSKLNA